MPKITAPFVPTIWNEVLSRLLRIPPLSRIAISEYVRIRRFVHIGSIRSITKIFCVRGFALAIMYARG